LVAIDRGIEVRRRRLDEGRVGRAWDAHSSHTSRRAGDRDARALAARERSTRKWSRLFVARAAIDIEEASREGVKGATGIVERTRDGTENDT
jgi:hypothetical protein